MRFATAMWLACVLVRPVYGLLVGFGIWPYSPECAFACLRSLSSAVLDCSNKEGSRSNMDGSSTTSPQCYARSTPWLTTLAWCVKTQCARSNLTAAKLESFWEAQSTGDRNVAPKWGYTQSLESITQPPTQAVTADTAILNFTALVLLSVWQPQYNALTSVQRENVVESGYSITIAVIGFGTPVLCTVLGYLPYLSRLLDKIRPYVVYPSIIGNYHVRPLPYLMGNAPTVGQGIYIIMFFILNIIFTAVNYKIVLPHAWYANKWQEVVAFVFYRTGVYGFVLLPLTILFSSRNNILLWVTNWSHSTYFLLHRWLARMFTLYVLIHSILAVILWKDYGTFESEQKQTFWIWGVVATLATTLLSVSSGLYVRRFLYEFFLISHVMLSLLVIVGCWYHIYCWTGVSLTWGYETWIYCACAVWFFDRILRVARIFKAGIRRSQVIELGGGYVRVDIPGIRWDSTPGTHAYAYFPTLRPLRPWENHPFSVVPMALLQKPHRNANLAGTISSAHGPKGKDKGSEDTHVLAYHNTAGICLFIRKSTGITKHLQAQDSLLTLLDGPYANAVPKAVLRCDRVLLIGGGIGITSLLPWILRHRNVKLCWSIREDASCLIREVNSVLAQVAEKDLRVGTRLNVAQILTEEVEAGWNRVGVVVCGPGGLCDHVRAVVAEAGYMGKTVFELEVDAYSW